jgi:hypothetical protein
MLILLLLLILNVFFFVILKQNRLFLHELQNLNQELLSKVNFLILDRQLYYELRDKTIDINISLIDQNGNELKLISLLERKSNLILYIPKLSCNSCYEKFFQDYSKLDSLYHREILIISSLNDANRLNNFKRVNYILSPIYNSFDKNLFPNTNTYDLDKPYFIEVSNDGEIISTQILSSDNFNFIYDYFKALD